MKKVIAEKWIKALQSGKYKQGKSYLKTVNRSTKKSSFCCLGVLTDLYRKDRKKKGLKDLSGVKRTPYSYYVPSRFRGVIYSPWSIQGQPCTGLPLAVIKWAGIKHKECKYKSGVSNSYVCLDDNGRRTDFATLNDGDTPHTKPMSFNEIATIIQKKWKEL